MATLSEKVGLLRGLLDGERSFTGPFYLTVDVSRRCNLRCAGCYRHSAEAEWTPANAVRDMPLELFIRLCDELRELGTDELFLLGEGEPCLHPQLGDIVAAATTRGFRTTLVTNGTLLDDAVVDALVGAGLDDMRVSLWANEPADHPAGPRGFSSVIEGAKRVVARRGTGGPRVTLHRPITAVSFDGLESIIDHARETGCDGVTFSPFRQWSPELAKYALTPEQEQRVGDALRDLARRLEREGIEHNVAAVLRRYEIGSAVNDVVPCEIGWYHVRVRVDGSVFPCALCDVPLGNLNQSSFTHIWNGRAMRDFRLEARSPAGPEVTTGSCACSYCCHVLDSERIHRVFRWVDRARVWRPR